MEPQASIRSRRVKSRASLLPHAKPANDQNLLPSISLLAQTDPLLFTTPSARHHAD